MLASSQHIFLRKPLSSDADAMLEWENNPGNWEVSGTTKAFSKEEIKVFVNADYDINENKQIRYIICLNSTKETIGTIDLFEFDVENKKVGVGVLIADSNNRKKGYASEALNLIINHCRNELNIITVFCNIIESNTASLRLFDKAGFQFVEEQIIFEKKANYYELKFPAK